MPEWLQNVSQTQVDAEVSTLAIRLLVAWFCGWLVAVLARRDREPGKPDTLSLTLVLMSILIAMATQIIGDNIARAFSLVGALSIVRFRTAVAATRDVAFVLAAVVVGMAIGAGQYWVAGLGLVVLALAGHLNSTQSPPDAPSEGKADGPKPLRLTIQVGLANVGGWEQELERFCKDCVQVSAETVRRGSAMEVVYRLVPSSDFSASELVACLHAVPGVESVAVK